MKQTKITKSAKGRDCTVRIPGYCNFDPATTVAAHKNGGGMARKCSDLHIAYTCSSCHDVVDGQVMTEHPAELIKVWFYDGVFRTQIIMLEEGLVTIE